MLNTKQFYEFARKHNLKQEVIDEMAIPSYNHYSPFVKWMFFKRLDELTENIDFSNKTILDFGCGTGILFPKYICAKKIFACDLYPQIAKETAKILNLKVNFVNKINNIPDKSIDIVIFADVLEHIKDYDKLILNAKTKMKTGGILLVSLPTESMFYKFCRIIIGYGNKGHYHKIDPQKIVRFLDKVFKKNKEKNLPPLLTLFKLIRYINK